MAFAIFRLVFVPFLGVMPQGAYYTFYSENLSLSYFDHPPMIAYWLATAIAILGKTTWAIKLTTWLTAVGTMFVIYQLAQKIYDQRTSMRSIALLSSTVMMSILSLVATPDVPLLFFWSLSLLSLYIAIFEEKRIFWILGGIAMGLAFDSKYTAIFLPMCLGFFLIFSHEKRYLLKTIWPYLSVFIMVLCTFPVFYWNYQNDFASFAFQGASRANTIAEEGWKPEHILGSIAMQSTVLVPVLFIFIFVGLRKYWFQFKLQMLHRSKEFFLLSFFLPVFGGFMALSIMYWVKLNWIMPAYLAGVLFLIPMMSKKWFKVQLIVSAILHIVLSVQVFTYAFPIKSDDTWWGWEELATEVQKVGNEYPSALIFAGDHYKTTAELAFHLDQKIYTHNLIGNPSVHYDMVDTNFIQFNGRDAIYIDSDPTLRFPQLDTAKINRLGRYFSDIQVLEPIIIYKGDRPMRYFHVVHCQDYRWIKPQ